MRRITQLFFKNYAIGVASVFPDNLKYTFGANQSLTLMPTVTERPFPCNDVAFVDSVLEDHKKSMTDHNTMVTAFTQGYNPAPFVFTYDDHQIPANCNEHLVKITFDAERRNDNDLSISFVEWPENAGNPQSVSGEVYYSLVLWNGIQSRKGAAYLELRKAIETYEGGEYVTVVINALNSLGLSVFHANLTNQVPKNLKDK